MGAYSSQKLTIGNTPVFFDKDLLKSKGKYIPAYVVFAVEIMSIRMTAAGIPSHDSGILAHPGSVVTITGEHDIENISMVSSDLTIPATIFAEFFNDLD